MKTQKVAKFAEFIFALHVLNVKFEEYIFAFDALKRAWNAKIYSANFATFRVFNLVRLKSKIISYRNYKLFNEANFLHDVQNANFICNETDADINYDNLVNTFREIVDKHAPLKHKTLRGNQAPFMTRELRKAIYNRSRLQNKLHKHHTNENRKNYKKQRNKCVRLRKIAIKSYFNTITKGGIMSNKIFLEYC